MRQLLIAATLLFASGAVAKPPPEVHTGTNTNHETAQMMYSGGGANSGQMEVQPTDQALAVGRSMARCVVSARRKDVETALAVSTADDFTKASRKLFESLGDCMAYSSPIVADVSQFQFGPTSLAGLLAEAMLRNGVSPSLAPAKYDANAPKLDALAGSQASLVQLRLGECLAQTQPDVVAAFVRSQPASSEEATALQAVVPFVPTCLDKNVTLKATRSSLRLALAFALYRRTIQPVAAAGALK